MNEQRHGSTRFSLDRPKKTWYTFANEKKKQSEGEVTFKVNAGGRTGDCKINCLNTTGVPIPLSVHSLSQMGATFDCCTRAAFFGNLTDQSFVQLQRKTSGHLFLSMVEDVLSLPILDKCQPQGFQVASSGTSRQIRMEKTFVLQHPHTTISPLTMTSASTPDQ